MDRASVAAPPGRTAGTRLAAWLAISLTLGGCATYRAHPLGMVHGVDGVGQLSAPLADTPWLPAHRLDPRDGLDVTELATLAVANSPELRLKRDALGVTRAQAFAAGLLPDPQLSVGEDFPRSSASGLTTAFNLGISADLSALLTSSTRVAAAQAQARQVNLDLLWAEWQTVAEARLLFERVTTLRTRQRRLTQELAALVPITRNVQVALSAGNLTYDAASSGLNALADVRKRLADNAVALHKAEADLHGLLGLAPGAPLRLSGESYRTNPSTTAVQHALDELPQRRPDLLALQAGYASQEATLRGAIRAQFPAITLGLNTARDTSAIYTNGFGLALTLPLFDRNRGNIAIATATRQQLRDDYQARVLATRNDIHRLVADLATLDVVAHTQAGHAGELAHARRAAETNWQQGLLDWPTYLAIRANALSADLDAIDLRQQQTTAAVALDALLGNIELVQEASSAKGSTPCP